VSTSSVLYAIQSIAIERNYGYRRSADDLSERAVMYGRGHKLYQQTCSSKRATHTKALYALGHSYFDSAMDLTAKPLPIDTTRHHSSSPPR
jgi:hypothetical protein